MMNISNLSLNPKLPDMFYKKIDIPAANSVRISTSTTDDQTLSICFFDDHLTASPSVASVLTSLWFSLLGPSLERGFFLD